MCWLLLDYTKEIEDLESQVQTLITAEEENWKTRERVQKLHITEKELISLVKALDGTVSKIDLASDMHCAREHKIAQTEQKLRQIFALDQNFHEIPAD